MIYDEAILYELSSILQELENRAKQSVEFTFTEFKNREELISYIDKLKAMLEQRDVELIAELHIAFLPTSTFQELAGANGWTANYLFLSEKLDQIIKTTGYKQAKGPDKRN